MKYWTRKSAEERKERIKTALSENVNFSKDASLGYPASKLDGKVFFEEAPFLRDAPILQSFVANPNHIGCHTFGTSEKAFKGTQEIEREVLDVIAIDIFKSEVGAYDGYIAPGGTEANIQAIWVYRNYFMHQCGAKPDEIAIISSEDTHYSIPKASNLLMIPSYKVAVGTDRIVDFEGVLKVVRKAKNEGKKFFIAVSNMGTTMFGAVDNPDIYVQVFEQENLAFKLHIDAAYGGFVYPFSNTNSQIDFQNPHISSITIDAHKMLQAPYGTGIFVCRKGLIENVLTKEAEYVEGMDLTLCGSRSGANAVAVWSILFSYGPFGWKEKVKVLQWRTDWLCKQLDTLGVSYYRAPFMNIVTIDASGITDKLVSMFDLVPQKHNDENHWFKIVVMEHVEIDDLNAFVTVLKEELTKQQLCV